MLHRCCAFRRAPGLLLGGALSGATKDHHDRITNKLIDGSSVVEDDLAHLAEILSQYQRELGCAELLTERCKAHNITEEDRH